MRQYFAIIKDSFRAALASRVLYVLLSLITLLLLVLAPFHYSETLDWKLIYQQHVSDPGALMEMIVERKDDPKHPEAARIWDQFPSSLRNEITNASKSTTDKTAASSDDPAKAMAEQQKNIATFQTHQKVIEGLNELIKDPDFYRAEDWKKIRLRSEAKELIESLKTQPNLKQSRRLNRLLIGRAFRSEIEPGADTALSAWYGPWAFEILDVPLTRAQFGGYVVSAIPGILDKFVLSIGLAIALLVTANIIPETFEPGSLNLLLSKPISRSGLFLSKFVGGCVFIALCATYLFVGIWLWLGLALGVWEKAILYSIVLYIIVFGIYYSVSALVGLVTRSTILSVIMTILFWGSCFLIGSGHGILNTRMQNMRIVKMVDSGGEVVQLNRLGRLSAWDGKNRPWQSMMPDTNQQVEMQMGIISYSANFDESREIKSPYGPVANPKDGTIIAGSTSLLNPLSFSRQPMLLANSAGQPLKKTGKFPNGIVDLLSGKTMAIAVTKAGSVYRFQDPFKISRGNNKNKRDWFVAVSPEEKIGVATAGLAAINALNDELIIYNKGTLTRLAFDAEKDQYRFVKSANVETKTIADMSCLTGCAGDVIVLAMGNGDIILIDANTLKESARFTPSTTYPVTQIAATADGKQFFFQSGDKTLWMLDTAKKKIQRAPISGQGSISAVAISGDATQGDQSSQLLVADRMDRVTRYSLPDFETIETLTPPSSFIERAFRYCIRPLYQLWPKPGEFYKVVSHLSSTRDAAANRDIDLRLQPRYQNPWSPLTGGLAFMAVMLTISCIYFSRKDY